MGFRTLLQLRAAGGTSLRVLGGDRAYPLIYLSAAQEPAAVVVGLNRDQVRDLLEVMEEWLLDTSPAGRIAPSVQG